MTQSDRPVDPAPGVRPKEHQMSLMLSLYNEAVLTGNTRAMMEGFQRLAQLQQLPALDSSLTTEVLNKAINEISLTADTPENQDKRRNLINIVSQISSSNLLDVGNYYQSNPKSIETLIRSGFSGNTPIDRYRNLIDTIIQKQPSVASKLFDDEQPSVASKLFDDAVYTDNVDLVRHLVENHSDRINISEQKNNNNLRPYQAAVAASAQRVERYFSESRPELVGTQNKLFADNAGKKSTPEIIKAAITCLDPADRNRIDPMIDRLYARPDFKPTLDLLACEMVNDRTAMNKAARIFITTGDNIGGLTPKSNGRGDFDPDAGILRLASGREDKDLEGTLIHEFTHMAVQTTFQNDVQPFRQGDAEAKKQYVDAFEEMKAQRHTLVGRSQIPENPFPNDPRLPMLQIARLLVDRMDSYEGTASRIQENEKKTQPNPHTLDHWRSKLVLPEYLVSVPQGMVTHAQVYDAPNHQVYPQMAKPMMNYYQNVFNPQVLQAVNSHPNRNKIDNANVSKVDIPEGDRKYIGISAWEVGDYIDKNIEFPQDRTGYAAGHITGQKALVGNLIAGRLISKILEAHSDDKVPQADATRLVENLNKIFQSDQFKNCHRDVFNSLMKYKEKNPGKNITDIYNDPKALKEINDLIPKSVQQAIVNTVNPWKQELNQHHQLIQKHINALKIPIEARKIFEDQIAISVPKDENAIRQAVALMKEKITPEVINKITSGNQEEATAAINKFMQPIYKQPYQPATQALQSPSPITQRPPHQQIRRGPK